MDYEIVETIEAFANTGLFDKVSDTDTKVTFKPKDDKPVFYSWSGGTPVEVMKVEILKKSDTSSGYVPYDYMVYDEGDYTGFSFDSAVTFYTEFLSFK